MIDRDHGMELADAVFEGTKLFATIKECFQHTMKMCTLAHGPDSKAQKDMIAFANNTKVHVAQDSAALMGKAFEKMITDAFNARVRVERFIAEKGASAAFVDDAQTAVPSKGVIMAVVESDDAAALKDCMKLIFQRESLPNDMMPSLASLVSSPHSKVVPKVALEALAADDFVGCRHCFAQLGVAQAALRELRPKESRQAILLQAQVLVAKHVVAPRRLSPYLEKLLDGSSSSQGIAPLADVSQG